MSVDCRMRPYPLLRLTEWWEEKRGAAPMPPRSALDPGELRDILPFLFIVDARLDPDTGARTLVYRLTGSAVDECLGVNLTGKPVDLAPFDGDRSAIRAQYEAAISERRPISGVHHKLIGDHRCEAHERLVVPLASHDPNEVAALLGVIHASGPYALPFGAPATCPGAENCTRVHYCFEANPILRPARPVMSEARWPWPW